MDALTIDVCHIAKTAGRMLREQLGCPSYVSFKGWADLVTDVDLKVQYFIEASLKEVDGSISIIAEEQSAKPVRSEAYWVVDPIDGTTNFVHGYPSIATSISLIDGVGPRLGVVYDPLRDELFCAERGAGAHCDGRPIAVSHTQGLATSLIAFGVPYDRIRSRVIFRAAEAVYHAAQSLRLKGPASLDLAYIACGRLDGYFELDLQVWDASAGALIVTEAGGVVTDWHGRALSYSGKVDVIAGNTATHASLLTLMSELSM